MAGTYPARLATGELSGSHKSVTSPKRLRIHGRPCDRNDSVTNGHAGAPTAHGRRVGL